MIPWLYLIRCLKAIWIGAHEKCQRHGLVDCLCHVICVYSRSNLTLRMKRVHGYIKPGKYHFKSIKIILAPKTRFFIKLLIYSWRQQMFKVYNRLNSVEWSFLIFCSSSFIPNNKLIMSLKNSAQKYELNSLKLFLFSMCFPFLSFLPFFISVLIFYLFFHAVRNIYNKNIQLNTYKLTNELIGLIVAYLSSLLSNIYYKSHQITKIKCSSPRLAVVFAKSNLTKC